MKIKKWTTNITWEELLDLIFINDEDANLLINDNSFIQNITVDNEQETIKVNGVSIDE